MKCEARDGPYPMVLTGPGEDLAYYLQHSTGCFPRIGTGEADSELIPAHTSRFYAAESSIFVAAAVLAEAARVAPAALAAVPARSTSDCRARPVLAEGARGRGRDGRGEDPAPLAGSLDAIQRRFSSGAGDGRAKSAVPRRRTRYQQERPTGVPIRACPPVRRP